MTDETIDPNATAPVANSSEQPTAADTTVTSTAPADPAAVDQTATTEVTNVPTAQTDTQGTDDATAATPVGAAQATEETGPTEQAADPTPAAPVAQEPAQPDPEPAAAAVPAVTDAVSTDKELDAFLDLPVYTSPAPAAPYHLIDTEHYVLNLIASHLDKVKDEAIAEIEKVETAFSNLEVISYKDRILAWLRAQ